MGGYVPGAGALGGTCGGALDGLVRGKVLAWLGMARASSTALDREQATWGQLRARYLWPFQGRSPVWEKYKLGLEMAQEGESLWRDL